MKSHFDYLQLALEQACLRRGFCAPNPAVGAVLVKDNSVLAQGTHWGVGSAHAEIAALKMAGETARGASLYVTLEPCNHQGRTPPCTEAIIQHGISAVYYAYADPNPNVTGKGAQRLREAGLRVEYLPVTEIDEFYRSYAHWLKQRRPFVTAKLALSLDGKIAAADGQPLAISGAEAILYTHEARRRSDAILTSVRTIIKDDPQLNVRLENESIAKPLYIMDRLVELPLDAKVLQTAESITLFHANTASKERLRECEARHIRCIELPSHEQGLSESAAIEFIGLDGKHDLWLEAGGKLFERFYESTLINRALFYVAPKVLGENAYTAFQRGHNFANYFKKMRWVALGQDVMCVMEEASP